jgi:hypothetical protein
VRGLIDAEVLSVACGEEALRSGGLPGGELRALANTVLLREALANASAFARYVGDALVLGGGTWNLGRDHVANKQDNLGGAALPKLPTAAAVVSRLESELAEVAAAVAGAPQPWRDELARRVWWREQSAFEYQPRDFHEARYPDAVRAANAAARRAMAAAGVSVIPLFKYTNWVNDTDWARSTSAPGNEFTRDGVHPHGVVLVLQSIEVLAAVAHAQPGKLVVPDDHRVGCLPV